MTMKAALRKFFGSQEVLSLGKENNSDSDSTPAVKLVKPEPSTVIVKTEPVFCAEEVNVERRSCQGRYGPNRVYSRGVKRNSVDRNGNIRKCFVCDSQFHFVSSCPRKVYQCEDSFEDEEEVEEKECYITSVSGSTAMAASMVESFNYAVLDSACNSTVCGNVWLQAYKQTLSKKEMLEIKEKNSDTTFRFGDGGVQKSMKKVKIPVTIVGKKVLIETDVVDCDIPLLWSKPSMKRADVKLNLEDDTAMIFGRKLNLTCTLSGHYRIPLVAEYESRQKIGRERRFKKCVPEKLYSFNKEKEDGRRSLIELLRSQAR